MDVVSPVSCLCACDFYNDADIAAVQIVYHLLRNQSAVDIVNAGDAATPLFYAVQKGFSECVRLLVRAGADPHFVVAQTGMSIVQTACNGSNVEALRQVMEVVNVNAIMDNGRTALHWACYYGKMPFVRQLVGSGASVHVEDEEGCTPLFWAVYSGHANVVRHLLRHGADSQAKASDGSRPLHWAATYNHPTVCELLLLDDCDVDAMYNYGMTALHHAADLGFDQIVTVLLAHKASTEARVREQTAMDFAVAKGHKRVVELLGRASEIAASRDTGNVPLSQLSAEEMAGFLSLKHLAMYVDKFTELSLDGKQVTDIFKNTASASVFMQSVSKDVVERFRQLCQQGMYNISDAKRGGYSRAMKFYEEKLQSTMQLALKHGVNHDEVCDETFSLGMERQYEARRVFQAIDVDHSGFLDSEEIAHLAASLGFPREGVGVFLKHYDADRDGKMSSEEFVSFFNEMKNPSRKAQARVKKLREKSAKRVRRASAAAATSQKSSSPERERDPLARRASRTLPASPRSDSSSPTATSRPAKDSLGAPGSLPAIGR